MAQRTRADSPTRTCTTEGCDSPLRARGLCSRRYKTLRRDAGGTSDYTYLERTCVTCGSSWVTSRPEARFCTAKCKGAYLSVLNTRLCKLPADHPVLLLTEARKRAERDQRQAARREAQRSTFAWRTARECPGCACWFTPLHTPTTICCSRRCARRVHRWRRKAAERDAVGTFTWSQFMAIARRFDYCCAYCGEAAGQLDPDHVVPLSRGGHNSTTNLLPACPPCNTDKRDLLLGEWTVDRHARGKPPRTTAWEPDDRRVWHLTQALPATPAAA